ncbi:MAG: exodeoxyribonuclease VII small subunit [Pseudomonadales bacterium]|nr:exodeoxyribonuclease VII small subunit [Pseudomonadales bacterium]
MSARKPKLDLDQSLEKLEDLVLELEGGGLTLEGSLKTFEDGIKLTRDCQKMLDKAEQKVRILLEEDSPSQTQSDQQ